MLRNCTSEEDLMKIFFSNTCMKNMLICLRLPSLMRNIAHKNNGSLFLAVKIFQPTYLYNFFTYHPNLTRMVALYHLGHIWIPCEILYCIWRGRNTGVNTRVTHIQWAFLLPNGTSQAFAAPEWQLCLGSITLESLRSNYNKGWAPVADFIVGLYIIILSKNRTAFIFWVLKLCIRPNVSYRCRQLYIIWVSL